MKDLGAITSIAIYMYWVMPLHFCPRGDARLSLPKSIPWDLYHLLPPKSSRRLTKVCLGKDSEQGSRPDLRRQRPYFQLLLWSRIRDLLSFFETASTPSEDERISEVVPVKSFQMSATLASFGFLQRPRQSFQRSPATSPSSQPVEKPSHLPPGMTLHLNLLAVNHLP